MESFIRNLPKVELHLHIEGTLEPELMFKLAERNKSSIPFKSIDDVKKAYQFHNLQSFLDIYYQSCQVLIKEQDFFELAFNYFTKAYEQNVRHCEIFFDPQTHLERDIPFEIFMNGFLGAADKAQKKFGISSTLIMCFLRHLSEEDANTTLELSLPFRDKIIAVGLDSSEKNNPPSKFKNVFKKAKQLGLKTVAHAGEEGPPEYIWQTLDMLEVERIDHGVRCLEDDKLVSYLVEHKIPLTVCPLSNIKLCVFPELQAHPIKKLLDLGTCVTINSDDPAYFGGYIEENYLACQKTFNLTEKELIQFAKNGINASFLLDAQKDDLLAEINKLTKL